MTMNKIKSRDDNEKGAIRLQKLKGEKKMRRRTHGTERRDILN
jgi:hypothetical protein